MKEPLAFCIDRVKEWAGNDYLYFDDALKIKLSPHSAPVYVWGVCISPDDVLYIMDNNQEWTAIDNDAPKEIIQSLYQRLVWMGAKYAQAS